MTLGALVRRRRPSPLRVLTERTSLERLAAVSDLVECFAVAGRAPFGFLLEPFCGVAALALGVRVEGAVPGGFAPRRSGVPEEFRDGLELARLDGLELARLDVLVEPAAASPSSLEARSVRSTSPSSDTGRSGTTPPSCASMRWVSSVI